jgi:hypothetical protein
MLFVMCFHFLNNETVYIKFYNTVGSVLLDVIYDKTKYSKMNIFFLSLAVALNLFGI